MSEYVVWLWLLVFIFAVVIEFATVDFVSIWFAIAAIPTMIIAVFYPTNVWLQVIVFFVTGFILMALTRPVVINYFKKNIVSTNVDSYVGKTAIVTKEISDTERGAVEFERASWTAISNETIEVGAHVRILAIEGNKFIVTKINTN